MVCLLKLLVSLAQMVIWERAMKVQYGLLHYYGTSVGPGYKLTYFKSTPVSFTDSHGAACFNAPVFTTLYPGLFCSTRRRSQLRSA